MNRVTVKLALLILVLVLLSGCSAFDKTYVVEADYPLAARKEVSPDDTLTVSGLSDLRDGIRSVVADGLESRTRFVRKMLSASTALKTLPMNSP